MLPFWELQYFAFMYGIHGFLVDEILQIIHLHSTAAPQYQKRR
jgi:hypothetical protein